MDIRLVLIFIFIVIVGLPLYYIVISNQYTETINLDIYVSDALGRPIDSDYEIKGISNSFVFLERNLINSNITGFKNNVWNNSLIEIEVKTPGCTVKDSFVINENREIKLKLPCFSNRNVSIVCEDCSSESVSAFERYQNSVFDCLYVFFQFAPNLIRYELRPNGSECRNDDLCVIFLEKFNYRDIRGPLPGYVHPNKTEVESPGEVLPDVHETTHAFAYSGLGKLPKWFSEGLAEYTLNNLECHPRQDEIKFNRFLTDDKLFNFSGAMYSTETVYGMLKTNETTYEECCTTDHRRGWIFFFALDNEGCDQECLQNLINLLHEEYLKKNPVTAEMIMEKTSELLGKELDVYELLKII